MIAWSRRGVAAALSLILSAGAARSYGTQISVAGWNSRMAGGSQSSPDTRVTFEGNNSTDSATFQGVSDVFAPSLDTGEDYTRVDATTVKFSASQLGAASDWGSDNWGDDLPASVDPSTAADNSSYADLTLQQSPQAVVSEVVNSPLAAWQTLTGLLAVIVLTIRPPKAAKAPG